MNIIIGLWLMILTILIIAVLATILQSLIIAIDARPGNKVKEIKEFLQSLIKK